MSRQLPALVFAAGLIVIGTECAGAEATEKSGLWGGIDVGAGRVERSAGGLDTRETNVYLGFKAGYVVHPRALVGVELSGWNQEATDRDDPTRGEGLMQLFVIGRLYPVAGENVFARVGGGWARQWRNGPTGTATLDGWGATLGVGYDVSIGDGWAVTPFLNLGLGETGGLGYRSITLGAGLTFF